MEYKKKLIEVALPLEKINEAAAYEKMPGIGPHPRGLHLWWARRPFTAARAVLWSSLIDDPSSHPEKFPTQEDQNEERKRLFTILENLVEWKNSNNEEILSLARNEILKHNAGVAPVLLDPFAGGGAIPLEAQRLGLEAHAHDLNPVAVAINKAMIEIPSVFSGHSPVNPNAGMSAPNAWYNMSGVAADVRYYGEILREMATERLGHMYPQVAIPKAQGGGKENAIAWIWARTVKCSNPICGCTFPLVKSFDLAKKKGREASIAMAIGGDTITYEVVHKKATSKGTISRSGAICPKCGATIDFNYIRNAFSNSKVKSDLLAVVAERRGGRIYVSPDEEQLLASRVERPVDAPSGILSGKSRVNVSLYGINETADLFSNRQLATLSELGSYIKEIRKIIEKDAIMFGMSDDHLPLENGGSGAFAYSQAIIVYLSFILDRLADFSTSVSRWAVTNEKAMNCFSKQAIPMTWDYPEVNILGNSVGSISQIVSYVADCIETLPNVEVRGVASQHDAQTDCGLRNIMISTDPPYYDNISYADLSDFFYVWMRNSLAEVYPKLFSTMLVPKAEELVATPYRFDGNVETARDFFEDGMLSTCTLLYQYASDDIPVTIYYAYKQSETEETETTTQVASTGWETMLSAIIKAGFSITGTWPMRTEQAYRAVSMGANALASSIVLVCRKRPEDAPQTTKKNLVNALRRELRPALKKLQDSNIAPVDLAQSAIGPGMGVFSQYKRVLEADGTPMTVRSALQVINEEIDLYFNEQVGSLDTASRFCVDLYTQCAYNDIKYGEAEVLANAKGTSIPMMASHGVLYAKAGIVHIVERENLPDRIDTGESNIWMLTQQLTHAMAKGGVEACAKAIFEMFGSNAENAKDLAYRLYTIAERKGWANEAYAYNSLVVAWPDIQTRAAELKQSKPEQMTMFDI